MRVRCVTQYVFVKRASEVDVHQLAVVEGKTQDLTSKSEIVQMIWVDGGITVGLKGGTCRKK